MSEHKTTASGLVPLVVAVSIGLASWLIMAASREMARNFSVTFYSLANVIVFLDLFDFCVRLYIQRIRGLTSDGGGDSPTSLVLESPRFTTYQKRLHVRPWAMIVSVCNAEHSLDDFLEAVAPLRDHVWIVDDGSADNTSLRLRLQGWRCIEGGCNRKKPGAIQFLLSCLPPEIETVVVVDPDITIRGDPRGRLEEVIFDFQQSGMAAVCPRISIRKDGFLARLQALEYCLSFCLGRKSLGDHSVNSGISLYRRSALAAEMQRHSLSVYAEDFENSVLLLGSGERIYYDSRIVVETEGKRTWSSWFSQRVGWSFGLIKVYFERFREIRKLASRGFSAKYQFLVYLGVFTLLFQPLKMISFALLLGSLAQGLDGMLGLGWLPYSSLTDPVYFFSALVKYTLLISAIVLIVVPHEERRYVIPIVPLYLFYALAQVIPTTVGYANWFSLRVCGRRLVRDHYQDEDFFRRQYEHKSIVRMVSTKLWPSLGRE